MNRLLCRLLPVLAGITLAVAARPGLAQAPAEASAAGLPGWVVPVLRLVSATHVEPTTGVVLAPGRVLVPLDFGEADDEIVVLDGGTDIVRNGRPARVERRFPELGLKVLAVDGLQRSAAPAAATLLADGAAVTLAAFPPAEDIEAGAPPLRQAASIQLAGNATQPAIAADVPLPNVTGALLDACGYLAGYSVADGVQAMAPSAGTRYRWQAALAAVREALGLPAGGRECRPVEPVKAEEAVPAFVEETAPLPEPQPEPESQPEPEPEAPPAEPEPELPVTILPPEEDTAPETAPLPAPVDEQDSAAAWWWLAGALLLIAAGLVLHRLRKRVAAAPAAGAPLAEAAVDAEPGAAALAADTPSDCRVVLRGQYADGRPLEVSAPASAQAIHLEIGRGTADLPLDSPAVSRRHARLNGRADALTLADLGSSNGSSINGVPCLEDEILYVEPGDTVILGDVRFTIELERTADDTAARPGDGPGRP